MTFPPRQISDKVYEIDITGYLFPWIKDHPVLVTLPGTPDLFLPMFKTESALRNSMAEGDVDYDSIKRIDDVDEFLESLPLKVSDRKIWLMTDPVIIEAGTTRFRELLREQ